jgi:hypothetical protein
MLQYFFETAHHEKETHRENKNFAASHSQNPKPVKGSSIKK